MCQVYKEHKWFQCVLFSCVMLEAFSIDYSRWGRPWQQRRGLVSAWCRCGSRTRGLRWDQRTQDSWIMIYFYFYLEVNVKRQQLTSILNWQERATNNPTNKSHVSVLCSAFLSHNVKCKALQIYLALTLNVYTLLFFDIIFEKALIFDNDVHPNASLCSSFKGEQRGASFLN